MSINFHLWRLMYRLYLSPHSRKLTHWSHTHTHTVSLLLLISMCGNVGADQKLLCWAVKRVAACVRTRTRPSSLLLRCEDHLLPGLRVLTGTCSHARYQITPYLGTSSSLWWLPAETPPIWKCQRECLCELKALTGEQHLEKPVRLFPAWLESLCTCSVTFCSLWMIVTENRECTTFVCYTSVMWLHRLILNWKVRWNKRFVNCLMIHDGCWLFCCRDLACWLTLNCAACEETLT